LSVVQFTPIMEVRMWFWDLLAQLKADLTSPYFVNLAGWALGLLVGALLLFGALSTVVDMFRRER
jgi:hypothetical protein